MILSISLAGTLSLSLIFWITASTGLMPLAAAFVITPVTSTFSSFSNFLIASGALILVRKFLRLFAASDGLAVPSMAIWRLEPRCSTASAPVMPSFAICAVRDGNSVAMFLNSNRPSLPATTSFPSIASICSAGTLRESLREKAVFAVSSIVAPVAVATRAIVGISLSISVESMPDAISVCAPLATFVALWPVSKASFW